jgi:hypothetical protein
MSGLEGNVQSVIKELIRGAHSILSCDFLTILEIDLPLTALCLSIAIVFIVTSDLTIPVSWVISDTEVGSEDTIDSSIEVVLSLSSWETL